MPSFSDKNITFTGEINRKGIAAMMEQLNKDAEQDGTLDLADLRVFKQQYEDNFRSLKYFGMQYIADEDVVSDLIPGYMAQDLGASGDFSQLGGFPEIPVPSALPCHIELSETRACGA